MRPYNGMLEYTPSGGRKGRPYDEKRTDSP